MDIFGKVWGKTQPLISNNNFSIHRLEIKKGSFCSKHLHKHKYNKFYVESGKLKVKIWKNDYKLIDEIILNKGESTTISPGEYHQFESVEDCIVYEIYWVCLTEDDIVRETVGGKNEK
jgi:mannose-6-phosphate isomerase-like protein (cupin superfamily)